MESDENAEILRILIDDLREALKEKKASRATKLVWAAYLEARRRIFEADQRVAQVRP